VHVRQTSLRLISHIAQLSGLQQKSWFDACTLLDVYILKTMDPDNMLKTINSLPATCAALICILKKDDCATVLVSGSSFAPHASMFAQYLQKLGYTSVNAEVTEEMINCQERVILQALGWRIRLPSTERWTTAYRCRFNVLSRSLMEPCMNWVEQTSLFGARLIMMQRAANEVAPPRELAAGLFAIGLVWARLLPLEAIRPPQMSIEEWTQLYTQCQPQGPRPSCVLPPNHSQAMLELLTVSVKAELGDIKEYARLSCLAMRDAVNEAKAQGACAPPAASPQAHNVTV